MNQSRIAAAILIGLGTLALIYGKFSYVKDSHETKLGPIEFTVQDRETVNLPVWLGVGAIVAGSVLLFAGKKNA